MIDKIQKAIDNKNYSGGMIIDLCKAFDTVDHHVLLAALYFRRTFVGNIPICDLYHPPGVSCFSRRFNLSVRTKLQGSTVTARKSQHNFTNLGKDGEDSNVAQKPTKRKWKCTPLKEFHCRYKA